VPRVAHVPLGVNGAWIASPIAVVGEVINIAAFGKQTLDRLPEPISPSIHDLYWCTGDLQVVAVVKGELAKPFKKYLWVSTIPGCELLPDNPTFYDYRAKTRVWFLREEGQFYRPPFDMGSHRFLSLLTAWSDGPALPPRQRLGTLLLTPKANVDSLEEYVDYFWLVGDIACELLGTAECTRRLRTLAGPENRALRQAACAYLKGELHEDCNFR